MKKCQKMKQISYKFLVNLLYIWTTFHMCDSEGEASYNVPVPIHQFESFAKVTMIEHTISPSTAYANWSYSVISSGHKDCAKAKVVLFLQRGSIPIYNVSKKTFPSDLFYTYRDSQFNVTFQADSKTHNTLLRSILPGTWFTSAFVLADTDDVIKILTTKSCTYALTVSLYRETDSGIKDILVNQERPTHVSITKSQPITLRAMTTEYTQKIDVTVTSCVVNDTAVHQACPITMRISSDAPLSRQSASSFQKCTVSSSTHNICKLTLHGPSLISWQYLTISKTTNADITIKLHMNTTEFLVLRTSNNYKDELNRNEVTQNHIPTTVALPKKHQHHNSSLYNHAQNDSLSNSTEIQSVKSGLSTQRESQSQGINNSSMNYKIKSDLRKLSLNNKTIDNNTYTVDYLAVTSNEILLEMTSSLLQDGDISHVTSSSNVSMTTITKPPLVNTRNADIGPSGATLEFHRTAEDRPRSVSFVAGPNYHRFMRYENPENVYRTTFFIPSVAKNHIPVNEEATVLRFDIRSPRDLGGELVVSLKLEKSEGNATHSDDNVTVVVCVQKHRLPVNDSSLACFSPARDLITLNTTGKPIRRVYPYPEPGIWLIGLQAECFSNDSAHVPCLDKHKVQVSVDMQPVSGCENQGYTAATQNGAYLLSYCQCRANYQGYVCTDDTHAKSEHTQYLYSLMLTLSNLAFIPGVCVALWRKYYVEALVYFANMFFSSFYHACDMGPWSKYMLCIAPYHVLHYSDFFCSIMSFWVTLIAVASLPLTLTHVMHMVGAIALATSVEWASLGLLSNVVPFSVGCGVILISWVVQCVRRRSFYPRPRQWLCIIPGMLLAGGGLTMFLLIETDDNYPYTHSVWHICMALSIVFLLPLKKKSKQNSKGETTSQESDSSFELNADLDLLTPDNALVMTYDATSNQMYDDEPLLQL